MHNGKFSHTLVTYSQFQTDITQASAHKTKTSQDCMENQRNVECSLRDGERIPEKYSLSYQNRITFRLMKSILSCQRIYFLLFLVFIGH